MLKVLCYRLSWSISNRFGAFEMSAAAQNRKN